MLTTAVVVATMTTTTMTTTTTELTFRVHALFKALVVSTCLASLSPLPGHLTLTTRWTHVLNVTCANTEQ